MRVLIVGCGYVGIETGRRLASRGHDVFGLRRSASAELELMEAGIRWLAADIAQPDVLKRLPGDFDWVVNLVSAGRGGDDAYREVYLHGSANLIQWLRGSPVRKFVYTSSTGVYGQTNGSEVDESSPTEPAAETGRILLETEALLSSAAARERFPSVILRASGIYGPNRGYWLRQFLSGEARIEGDGRRFLNMIHRVDLAEAIITALESGRPGEIYNATDDEPVTQIDLLTWLAQTLHRPMPPGSPDSTPLGNRAPTNKRVANRKLKEQLGFAFRFPTFREGFAEELRRRQPSGDCP